MSDVKEKLNIILEFIKNQSKNNGISIRYNISPDSTNGMLLEKTWVGYDFLCYTLEDEERDVKVKHETMIPYGRYEIKFRKEGGLQRYSERFADIHDGMLHITNVLISSIFLYIVEILMNTQAAAYFLEIVKKIMD